MSRFPIGGRSGCFRHDPGALDGAELAGFNDNELTLIGDSRALVERLQQVYVSDFMVGVAGEAPSTWSFRPGAGVDVSGTWNYRRLRRGLALLTADAKRAGKLRSALRKAERFSDAGETEREYRVLDRVAAELDAGVGRFVTRFDAERFKQLLTLTTGWTPEP